MATDESSQEPESGAADDAEARPADALRSAVERTLKATAPAAAETRERVSDLLDEVSRAGRDARSELARRSQELARRSQEVTDRAQGAREELRKTGRDAGAGIARRGQEATAELTKRLESLETRLASLESSLMGQPTASEGKSNPKAET